MDSGAPISKAEADHLFSLPKQVVGPIQWEGRPDGYWNLIVEVLCEDGTPMTVRGWRARGSTPGTVRRYGFSLVFRNSVVIRRWDFKPGHRDPITRSQMKGAHKHYADEHFGDSAAYETADVRVDDPAGALTDFLKECNISTAGVHIQKAVENFHG